MNVLGMHLKKPGVSGALAALLMAAAGLGGGALLSLAVGGSTGQVAGMAGVGFVAGLLSVCGASFEKAGFRGLALTTTFGVATYAAIVAAYAMH